MLEEKLATQRHSMSLRDWSCQKKTPKYEEY